MARLIIKYTIIEAYKRHFFTLFICSFIACIMLAYYAKSISISESSASFVYFYNACIRIVCVFLLAWHCVISQNNLFEKAGIQLPLSLPVSRTYYCFLNLSAYILIAFILALIASLPLLLLSEYHSLIWFFSLFLELAICVSIAYVLSLIFTQVTTSISIFTLVYIFSRNAAEFSRHAENVLPVSQSILETATLWMVKLTALIVPKLENYANSEILQLGANIDLILSLLIESAIYIALLIIIIKIEIKKKVL